MTKVKRVATIAFGQGVNVLVNFLFLPYMARVLSYQEYGTYGQVLLICAFASAILSFGMSQILYVYLERVKDKQLYFDSNLISVFTIALIGSLLIYFSAPAIANWFDNPKITVLLKIFAWSIPLQISFQSITSRLISESKVKAVAVISICANLLKVILVVLSIQIYSSIVLTFYSILFATAIQLLAALLICKYKESFRFDLKAANDQIKEGFPLGLTGLLGSGILYIDGFMVSYFLDVEAYAIYRNGAFEVPFVSTIYTSIAAIILPEVSKLYVDGKMQEIVHLKKKVIMNSMAVIYPVMIFLLFNSETIIVTYLGERYQESAILFSLFNLTLLMRVNGYHDILMSAGKSRVILWHYLLIFLLNIVLNLILIDLLGLIGAAISTVISLIIFAILLLRRNLQEVGAKLGQVIDPSRMLGILLISFFLGGVVKLISKTIENEIIALLLSVLLFFPLVYLLLVKTNFLARKIIEQLIRRK